MSSSPEVLVVDDDPQVGGLIKRVLDERGIACTVVTDSGQVAELLAARQPAVLVADISMPEVGGVELLSVARKVAPQCRVILVSGVSCAQSLAEGMSLGAYDYFHKPFDCQELADAVAKAMSHSQQPDPLVRRAAEAMQLETKLRRDALDSIGAMVRAVEAKDPYTRRHSEHVAHYGVLLGQYVGLPAAAVEAIRVASLVHDMGMIGVPDDVLGKAGKLTEEEFDHVRRHPALGAHILEEIGVFGTEAHLVRHHHERWDGQGYPDGLEAEEIPLGSRVILIADSIDTMLMPRCYKQAFLVERMLDELTRCAGRQYDPVLAARAVQWCMLHPEELILPTGQTAMANPVEGT